MRTRSAVGKAEVAESTVAEVVADTGAVAEVEQQAVAVAVAAAAGAVAAASEAIGTAGFGFLEFD